MRLADQIMHLMPPSRQLLAQGHDMLLHAVEHVQGVVEHESDSQAHGHQSNHRTDFEEPDIFFT